MSVISWILENYQAVIMYVNAVVVALIGLSLLIPGEQPEKALQSVADFLAKFSKK